MTNQPVAAKPDSGGAISDFGIDTTTQSTGEAVRDFFVRLRSGDLGSMPAVLGLGALVLYFWTQSESFLTLDNTANLIAQGSGKMIIAMGLVFVLLLGEIDLSAGTASGVCAAVMAMHYVRSGNLVGGMGSTVFYVFVGGMLVAAVLAVIMRIWAGAVFAMVAVTIAMLGVGPNPWIEMLLALCVGTAIGVITGFLVSKIGMPSFVVTLALFITWQGVILQFIGQGGVFGIGTQPVLFSVANGNLSVLGSWILFAVGIVGYAGVVLGEHYIRVSKGLVTAPTPIVVGKVAAVTVIAALATFAFTLNRSPNDFVVIEGVPYVVPIVLVLLVIGTYVLNRTRYGRHIYAVGGNAEAARRAGINVPKIRASVFVVCSSVAALGAIVYSSKVGSVDPQAGGLNTLLFAVGAAVIGGTSLFGGRGKIIHAVIGGLVLAVVENGLGLLQQPAAVVNIVTGLVLLLAASVDALSRRRAAVAVR
ncbi:D-xylose transport system permease protein [Actinokineospora alba]|uniref:Xylose transport system permease protein XylH n=1 Tax=Actinokineospora alba TaxID=504798 RepID=A0A1H0JCL0_9PSEU|nr:ABC transporter permease [Actinokineospora alba]TDP68355.1 D-xylose transport system permease protein [Actinokineospora alba]SDH77365.1 D-xylose transport system permease protein [Actinokineospora alba]SDO41091.1 D-xylose transport system permease protein [Actinokineospora alba]